MGKRGATSDDWSVLPPIERELVDKTRVLMERMYTDELDDAGIAGENAVADVRPLNRKSKNMARLSDDEDGNAQFYARADNLVVYLQLVEKQLGSFSQRLSASVGQVRLNTDLTGDPSARQSTPGHQLVVTRTPWLQIDNEFYEARGACYALIHLLKAVEHDFAPVLEDKNALVSLRQIIRELENTQDAVWSPVILNGGGFGFFANHSLVMANYISRASAALGDLRALLDRG